MTPNNWVESEERYQHLIQLERLERNLAFSKECLRVAPPSTRQFWQDAVHQDEYRIKTHLDSRTKQTKLEAVFA